MKNLEATITEEEAVGLRKYEGVRSGANKLVEYLTNHLAENEEKRLEWFEEIGKKYFNAGPGKIFRIDVFHKERKIIGHLNPLPQKPKKKKRK